MKKVMFLVWLSLLTQIFPQKVDNALSFDGSNDYVNISDSITSATETQPITVEAWIYPTTDSDTRVIASKYSGGSPSQSNIFITRNSSRKLLVSANGSDVIISNGTVPLNTWTHIAVVFQTGTNNTKIYINGTLDISGSLTYNTVNSTTATQIGQFTNITSFPPYQEWLGIIDEFRLWNTVRTEVQISAGMNIPLSGTETGLVAYYGFNQGTANGTNTGITTLTDLTGHGWNGTLTNFALTGTTSNWVEGGSVSQLEFLDINAGLTGIQYGSVAWGDYDNDGDLDVLLTGHSSSGSYISKIYRNDSNVFTDINAGLTGVTDASASWGDYDNDGDLDIILTGNSSTGSISKIYRNDAGVFTDINAGLTGVYVSSTAWGDFDNDGDLDILFSGYTGSARITKIYRNDAGVFTDINAGLTGVTNASVTWSDYDNDGDLDILTTGYTGTSRLSIIYRNNAGVFTDINAGLTGVERGSVAWGDYDNDGDLDILLTGYTGTARVSEIYRNDAAVFTDINAGLTNVNFSSAAWGDYDNDGDLDILLTGSSDSVIVSKIYRNDVGVFTDINADLTAVSNSSVAWGDYDNDGDIDILLTGFNGTERISKIFLHNSNTVNTAPVTPSNLLCFVEGLNTTLSWNKTTDAQTPQNGLSYNLYIGTISASGNKKSPMSNITTGRRKIVSIGNTGQANSYTIKDLPDGTYYWSVQAVDHAFSGSGFSSEQSFILGIDPPSAPVALPATNISYTQFTASWGAVSGAERYYLDVATDEAFTNYVAGFQNINVSNVTSYNITGLSILTVYYYRIRAYNSGGISENSNFVSVQTLFNYFSEISSNLQGVSSSSAAWGDYDSDGDLDILLTGSYYDTSTYYISKIYNNNSGVFTDINAGLVGVKESSVDWGDYDNDGDLDILLTGLDASYNRISRIYCNDNGTFTDINAGLPGVYNSSVAWGDYDNDGDLDILLTGYSSSGRISKIYRNDSGVFTDINAGLTGVSYSSVGWGDYDNDGDLDILLTGYYYDTSTHYISKIYRNDSGVFTDINAGLTGVDYSSVEWGDYDNDGDLDILLTGISSAGKFSKIYRNDSGVFTDINAGLKNFYNSSVAWGDYDNDGDLDILLTGYSYNTVGYFEIISKIYRNDEGIFTETNTELTGVYESSVEWGDYDNDGDLDILLTGYSSSGTYISKIYRNESEISNTKPYAPVNLNSQPDGLGAILSWDKASDDQTEQDGLSYNIYIGTQSVTGNIMSSLSDTASGYRKLVCTGNTGQTNSYAIKHLPEGMIYWSVQAIDHCFAGSEFSAEQSFIFDIDPSDVPTALPAANVSYYQFTANWESVDLAEGYCLDVATDDGFTDFVPGYQNLDVSNVTSIDITGLSMLTGYYYRIRSYNNGGTSDNSSSVYVQTLYTMLLDINAGLTGVTDASASWGDYDNDGDLDILLTGLSSSYRISKIYRNDSGVFTDINAGLTGVNYSSVAWGDYDNDGDLDILLTGLSSLGRISKIYRNDSGVFNDINAGLTAVNESSVAWGDYDNDCDLDILLTGDTGSEYVSKIYNNNSGVFTDINAGLTGVYVSSVAWGDYDDDGDLDILVAGYTGITGSERVTRIYKNDAGLFTDINAGLTGATNPSVSWGDYDSDGDLDILVAGTYTAKIYKNDKGVFTDIIADLAPVHRTSASWGDFDNDGDLDILLTGDTGSGYITKIYRNDEGAFTDINAGLSSVRQGSAVWGDYDNDDDLDILLAGDTGSGYVSKIYNNNYIPDKIPVAEKKSGNKNQNTAPQPPQNLSAQIYYGNHVLFSWDRSTDNETPQYGLSYNIMIGTSSNKKGTKGPMSNDMNGYRQIVSYGNTNKTNSWRIMNLPKGTYYWRVQAIDNSFAGSEFSVEGSFTIVYEHPTDINAGLTGVNSSSVAWGDYDNDGDLDILLTGYTGYSRISKIYRNNAGLFTDINAGLTGGVNGSSVAWGDYDSDGDLDILLTDSSSGRISKVYMNSGGVFADINASLVGVYYSSVAWEDYDNDGDLDILLTGNSSSGRISKIYRNDAGIFTDINAGLTGVDSSSVAWGDYDNDGDFDILLTGWSSSGIISKIYRNNGDVFTDINAGLTGVCVSSVAWGDYDNDGDLDILLTGSSSSGVISKVYMNDAGLFTDINTGLTGVSSSSVAWGDYDNDGDLDILLTGDTGSEYVSKIYNNNSGVFTDINAGLTGVYVSSVAWGDYDNDGDLDILLTGYTGSSRISKIYRNNAVNSNSKPLAPTNLNFTIEGSNAELSWDKATDTQTPQNGLSYNLYIGTSPLTGNEKSPMSNITTGDRKVVCIGNSGQTNSYAIKGLPNGQYYWGVQAVDHAFVGSGFSTEQMFFIGSMYPPQNVVISPSGSIITLSWSVVGGADSYRIFSCDDPYGTYTDISAEGVFAGTSWSYSYTGTRKFYYVVAVSQIKEEVQTK